MHRQLKRFALVAMAMLAFGSLAPSARAVVVCTLKDPDRDVRRFFPAATNFKTQITNVEKAGGAPLIREIEARLGDKLDPVYEGKDVEHTTYIVLKGTTVIGYVSGVNQKGEFGNMQIFTATDPNGKIVDVLLQRVVTPHAKTLNSSGVTGQFKGLSLKEFYENGDAVKRLKTPDPKVAKDFAATVRGVRKNLIYFDFFSLKRKHDDVYRKVVAAKGGK